jgi:S-adenosylmethionine-diacylglycerol 3-amino-3-carboxypropyl transferase
MTQRQTATTERAVTSAVLRHDAPVAQRLLDRAFALAFKGLVYAQIWEDPVADMAALDIGPGHHVICIASGGCNALSYLTADPASVTALDLNTAHVALNRLKIAALRHLPDYAALRRFFVNADDKANIAAYHTHIAPHCDDTTRRYWEGRDLIGRRRISGFANGIYKRGLLGHFIGMAHLLARAYDVDLRIMLTARDLSEQRRLFNEKLAPVFDKAFVRWLTKHPASIFGLGIPPAQYDALAGDQPMAEVLRARLEKLACDFPINDNYFAWQAFSRGYGQQSDAPLPPWLQPAHYPALRSRIDRYSVAHANLTDHLTTAAPASLDRYLLLDAQDWMSDTQLTDLWTQITRTARPGARVLFRTAGEETILPGRVPAAILDQWGYSAQESARLTPTDRSAIYGGLHLYHFQG